MKETLLLITWITLASCSENHKSEYYDKSTNFSVFEIEQVNWFLGTWQNSTTDGIFTESWKRSNDSLFEAVSTVVKGKDTLFYEKINLQKTQHDWNYIVSVKNQNNEKPVSFKLTSVTPTQFVFENPQHDFPTKIMYTQINKDSIVAEISGILNGVEKKEIFPMKRIK